MKFIQFNRGEYLPVMINVEKVHYVYECDLGLAVVFGSNGDGEDVLYLHGQDIQVFLDAIDGLKD